MELNGIIQWKEDVAEGVSIKWCQVLMSSGTERLRTAISETGRLREDRE
jgi:hypothetical protein